ncbi:GNAT family N-acetyltransferase [Agromyces archimandritae]|uniref:GNAT family N-acetyltransferase n=1 Tax=Agromyces archimandritae TaxID=2781962 RepID=A0A975FN75_9MICO|nr:GNAT family N-acetyltransferase [Agromyces archimandritae]QTX04962.1 GNAT family N-acetyltransferase [Agromyces archimandritae]
MSSVDAPALRIVSAVEVPFSDVEAVFGTRGDPAGCWCQWFKLTGAAMDATPVAELRGALEAQIRSGGDHGPGLIAYDGGTPVGWCAIEPRPQLPSAARTRIVKAGTANPDFADEGVWVLSCFVVPREHRRRGIGAALARAAGDYARERGARVIEGYAVDPGARAKTSAAELFHGSVSMFAGAGYEEVARPKPDRAIMQLVL